MTERLLACLNSHSSDRGMVVITEETLLREIGTDHERALSELAKLERAGLVEILTPLPFLVLKLRSWPGSNSSRSRNAQQGSTVQGSIRREVPVSSIAAAATQQREVGGAGEGEDLLDEVLLALGPEADRDEFRSILAGHAPALIHRALKRVQATKAIRVSRAALFCSLLEKLSR